MKQKRSKRHHFVPKTLQKQFSSHEDHIWYAHRDKNGNFSDVEDRNINSTFRINDLYTVLDQDWKMSDKVERVFYGAIDDYLGKMIPNCLEKFAQHSVPTFSGEALSSLRDTIFEMIKRTPDFNKHHDDTTMGRDYVEAILKATTEDSADGEREYFESSLNNPAELKKMGRNIRVRATAKRSVKIQKELEGFSAKWAVISGKASFILSGMIVYRIGNGGSNGLENPNMEIWMPISPKHAVVLLRDRENKIPLLVNEPTAHVRKVNEFAVKNSSCVASHSKDLLKSLMPKKH